MAALDLKARFEVQVVENKRWADIVEGHIQPNNALAVARVHSCDWCEGWPVHRRFSCSEGAPLWMMQDDFFWSCGGSQLREDSEAEHFSEDDHSSGGENYEDFHRS